MATKRPFEAYLDEVGIITILLPHSYKEGASSAFFLKDGNECTALKVKDRITLGHAVKYVCTSPVKPSIGKPYGILDEHGGETDLQIGAVIRTKEFDEAFYYDGGDLGVTLLEDKAVFKVWAPTASQVKLKLKRPGAGEPEYRKMTRLDKGVWCAEVNGTAEGALYSYLACINLEWREAVDPYAKGASANGEHGIVVDLAKTRLPKAELPEFTHPCDAVIYETHIRDLTMHPASGIQDKGTYCGAAQIGSRSSSGEPTGLSYIKSLGITHIEFLPFHDFEGVDELNPFDKYNWGYNPIHFNVPEGSFSTNPNDPYKRISELKQLISAVHSQGMRVIMDVVYNHVYIRETSSFEQLVPGYFFRHDEFGLPSNGTGVGNDFASERLMARKYILDSVSFWLEEYQVDGLRFDLMGILDVRTMQEVRGLADGRDPSIIIIGEGWDLNTPIPNSEKANIGNQEKLPGIGQFNDWFRDTIKGSTFNLYDRGYAMGNERYAEGARQVLAGSIGIGKRKHGLFMSPAQSVNYVESHDNHTLWDKLEACEADHIEKRHRLATSMVLLSQGIPFLHSGQEFFRTKKGVGNSYRSPDEINWLDWQRRDRHIGNVSYIRGIIALRLSHKAFRLPDAALVQKHMHFLPLSLPVLGYVLEDVQEYGRWETIVVVFNPSGEEKVVELPEENEWKILVDSETASSHPFQVMDGKTAVLPPCTLWIGAK
ncbi:type I pullulanase [Bacillus sp. FJAT-27251]|uniref:type I pullulanase n=1 Tax=Bacillus sp. FJAT-27251 TaxID=1684142 RepID=UPI0006A7DD6C|nr:type I pullulanase [Bacillus sp. FJAT-27251]